MNTRHIFCPKCKKECSDEWNYCMKCAMPLSRKIPSIPKNSITVISSFFQKNRLLSVILIIFIIAYMTQAVYKYYDYDKQHGYDLKILLPDYIPKNERDVSRGEPIAVNKLKSILNSGTRENRIMIEWNVLYSEKYTFRLLYNRQNQTLNYYSTRMSTSKWLMYTYQNITNHVISQLQTIELSLAQLGHNPMIKKNVILLK